MFLRKFLTYRHFMISIFDLIANTNIFSIASTGNSKDPKVYDINKFLENEYNERLPINFKK